MAERLARQKYPDNTWESAGVIPTGSMHPMTARVLTEFGADTTGFCSRDVAKLDLVDYDCLVLIGDTARNLTPDPPLQVETHFWDVPDPYNAVGTDEEIAEVYRKCAGDLLKRIGDLLEHS